MLCGRPNRFDALPESTTGEFTQADGTHGVCVSVQCRDHGIRVKEGAEYSIVGAMPEGTQVRSAKGSVGV
jgi:hypothetical protein